MNITINSLIGIPWKMGGRSPEEGFDCWGLLKYCYLELLGITIKYDYDIIEGGTPNIIRAISSATDGSSDWVLIEKPINGCAVALSRNKKTHHVGFWYNDHCIHATEKLGVVGNTMNGLKRNQYNKVEFYRCKIQ